MFGIGRDNDHRNAGKLITLFLYIFREFSAVRSLQLFNFLVDRRECSFPRNFHYSVVSTFAPRRNYFTSASFRYILFTQKMADSVVQQNIIFASNFTCQRLNKMPWIHSILICTHSHENVRGKLICNWLKKKRERKRNANVYLVDIFDTMET